MNKFYNKRVLIILICIICLGGFLRFYNTSKWMHYELDQVRDYKVVHTAVKQGISYLPLQGPRAAGSVTIADNPDKLGYGGKTTLRLGPLFYYIEYISAILFGDTPYGSIVLIIFLSVASIVLFYLLINIFFSEKISLGLTTVFTSSLFFISYSRFSWNPNLIPFFSLLSLYSLLKAMNPKAKSKKERGWWLILCSGSFAFLSNMHFLALIAFGGIIFITILFIRPKISIKFWLASALVFCALNTPLIINDFKTNGENSKAFLSSILNSNKKEHSIFEKITREALVFSRYNWISITGFQRAEIPMIKRNSLVCDKNCKEGLTSGLISLIILIFGFFMSFYLYLNSKEAQKKNFLIIVLVWSIISFVLYLPLSYDFSGRFFLIFAPVSLIFVGIILYTINDIKYGTILVNAILFSLIVSNLWFTFEYFLELKQSSVNINFDNRRDYILGEKTRITYMQISDVFDYMIEKQQKNNFPIFLHGQSEFERVFRKFNYEKNVLRRLPKELKPLYRNANYFLIIRTQSDFEKVFAKYIKAFDIIEKRSFGTITIYYVKPKEKFITNENVEFAKFKYKDPVFDSTAQVRYLWHQVFSGCNYDYKSKKCEKN